MKKINMEGVRIVAEIPLTSISGERAWNSYRDAIGVIKVSNNWMGFGTLDRRFQTAFESCLHPEIIVSVVGYTVPDNPTRGLTHKESELILKKAGVKPLSTKQTLHLATETKKTGDVLRIACAHDCRNIASTVPFNPEIPSYFYFGMGTDRKGSFHCSPYFFLEKNKGGRNLYFWQHEGATYSPRVGQSLQQHFPLLLGIKIK